jgi:hypothetical protein
MYAVCTRPVDGPNPGLGLVPAAAMAQVETAQRQFDLEPDPRTVISRWKDLVVRYGVTVSVGHFLQFVFCNFYPAVWREHHFLRSWKRVWREKTITDNELSSLHFSSASREAERLLRR